MKSFRILTGLVCLSLSVSLLAGCQTQPEPSSSVESQLPSSSAAGEENALPLLPQGGWQEIPSDTTAPDASKDGTLLTTYTPKYSKNFSIEYYYGGAKIIATNVPATASTLASAQRVLLLPEGATEPKDVKWDHKINGAVERVVTLASSHAGHFSNLDSVSYIKGSTIKAESCFIPTLKTALENGDTKYVGTSSKPNLEEIAALQPQIVFVGGMTSASAEFEQKMTESGTFCLYFGDFAESDYMGRAEWVELIGAFIGKEQEAQDYMKNSEAGINEIIARASKIEEKPSVLWFTHSSSVPHWSVRTNTDYAYSIVNALGGKLLYPEDCKENSAKLSNEDFLPLMQQADRMVFGVSLNSYKDAKDITYFNKEGQVDFAQSKAYKNDGCFVVGYDWAQDTVNVLGILRSMAVALYPEEFKDFTDVTKIIPFKQDV